METEQINDAEEGIDLKEFILKFKFIWHYVLLSVLITLGIAYFINKYYQPVYSVSTTILLKKEKPLLEMKGLSTFDDLSYQNSLNDETEILKATSITERVLSRLNFNIAYYQKVPFGFLELYKDVQFEIIPDSAFLIPYDVLLKVNFISDSSFLFSTDIENLRLYNPISQEAIKTLPRFKWQKIYKIGKTAYTPEFSFKITNKEGVKRSGLLIGQTYYFTFKSKESLINEYRNYSVSKGSSSNVLYISMKGNNLYKLIDFLNILSSVYLEKSIERKNKSASNTINFIESQLTEISDSLKFSEKKLQDFQSTNKVMDIDFHSMKVFSKLEELQNQKAELIIKDKYFKYLIDYLSKNTNGKDFVAPSSIGIEDGMLTKLMGDLLNLVNEKDEIANSVKKDIPYLTSYTARIDNVKKSVIEYLVNLSNATSLAIKNMDQRIAEISLSAEKLPKTQHQLFNYERIFKLNDAIYTFLLTKRSEIQISKAALIPDNEVINEANPRDAAVIAPNIRKNYLLALMIGLAFPILIMIILEYLSDRVKSIKDIERLTNFTILGHIIRDKSESMIPVIDDPRSLLAESFRSIRTNFQFVTAIKEKQTIVVTSSMMNEGKSYTSLNLAASFALYGKKTVLLYFDLRKPMRNVPFGYSNNEGLSTYLSSNCELDAIILPSVNDNLNIIVPGPVPPNPNELIASDKTKEMLQLLHEKFDYIVIDTPPVGMVADALLLFNYSNVNIFVVRHNYSRKGMIKTIVSTLKKRNIQNVNVVINDLPVTRNKYGYGYGYGYGYNYNYGYGYGYYMNEKRNIFKRILSRFRKKA